jgi:sulfur transfer protein SufE
MPIDEDIVKFSKQVPISDLGLEEFIWKNRDTAMNATLKRIQEEIEKIL